MTIKYQIGTDLITAIKAKESFKVKTLRSLIANIKQVEVDTRKELDESQILSLLQKQIKQRKESLAIYEINSRYDLSEIEKKELDILEQYLPKQMSEEQIDMLVLRVISDMKATTMKDMGKVMSIVKPLTAGQADPSVVSASVKLYLS